MNSLQLRQAAFEYAKTAQHQLGMLNQFEDTPKLVCHFLFPNLDEEDRHFLSDLLLNQFLYSTWVNTYVYEGDKSKEENKAFELEQKFTGLLKNPLLLQIKQKLSPDQLAVLAQFENTEILPPPQERK